MDASVVQAVPRVFFVVVHASFLALNEQNDELEMAVRDWSTLMHDDRLR